MIRWVLVLVTSAVAGAGIALAEDGNRSLGGWFIAGLGGAATIYFADQAVDAWSQADDFESQSRDPQFSYGRQLEYYERATQAWEDGNDSRNQAVLSAIVCGVGIFAARRSHGPDRPAAEHGVVAFDWNVSPAGAFVGFKGALPCWTSPD